jgi:hypothetical protein
LQEDLNFEIYNEALAQKKNNLNTSRQDVLQQDRKIDEDTTLREE